MKTTVALVHESDPRVRVQRVINLLGGMARYVSPGQTVLIKPNLVYPDPPPRTTDPDIIAALVEMSIAVGAKRVLVGESPSSAEKKSKGLTSRDVFEATGVFEKVSKVDGEIVFLDEDEELEVDIPEAKIYKKAIVNKKFIEADVLISVPVLKTHFLTDVTLGIKNLYGFVSQEHRKLYHRDDLSQKLDDLLKIRKPNLTVIDAGLAMEGLGPKVGSTVPLDITIAGGDVVACDAVGASLMTYDPMYIDHIRMAWFDGLGEARLENINIIGDKLEKLRREFQKPDLRTTAIYSGVTVIEGGVCRECRARTRWALDELYNKALLSKLVPLIVIVGVKPYIPDTIFPSNLIILGDCALDYFYKNSLNIPTDAFYGPGCPPDSTPRMVSKWAWEVVSK
ncbi:MAG: hypothetical protein VR72_16850 [Clostridiaceae bacterium BRH_c20a]|nr:MAG: hypothetical protein VR72_16850 [Clostridiaceae bacterium BRH_c20a]